jgi:hypothetical protein
MVRIDAEAICSYCGAKARGALDVDLLLSRRIASPGEAMHGLPDWYYKTADQNLFCDPNLACSKKCMAALAKEQTTSGDWKPCKK